MTLFQIASRVDARGLSCPMPIVKAAQAAKVAASGDLIEVLSTDPGSTRDFVAWCRTTGHELVEQDHDLATGIYTYVIRRK